MNSIYYAIDPIRQPKSSDCWITVLTTFKRWQYSNNSLEIEDILNEIGEPYKIYFITNSGLPHTDVKDFFDKSGLSYDEPQNFSEKEWYEKLANNGPLIVDIIGFIENDQVWTHSILLVGITLNDVVNESEFIYIDPAYGSEVKTSFFNFLSLYEAEPENQIYHIQVAYKI